MEMVRGRSGGIIGAGGQNFFDILCGCTIVGRKDPTEGFTVADVSKFFYSTNGLVVQYKLCFFNSMWGNDMLKVSQISKFVWHN